MLQSDNNYASVSQKPRSQWLYFSRLAGCSARFAWAWYCSTVAVDISCSKVCHHSEPRTTSETPGLCQEFAPQPGLYHSFFPQLQQTGTICQPPSPHTCFGHTWSLTGAPQTGACDLKPGPHGFSSFDLPWVVQPRAAGFRLAVGWALSPLHLVTSVAEKVWLKLESEDKGGGSRQGQRSGHLVSLHL